MFYKAALYSAIWNRLNYKQVRLNSEVKMAKFTFAEAMIDMCLGFTILRSAP